MRRLHLRFNYTTRLKFDRATTIITTYITTVGRYRNSIIIELAADADLRADDFERGQFSPLCISDQNQTDIFL